MCGVWGLWSEVDSHQGADCLHPLNFWGFLGWVFALEDFGDSGLISASGCPECFFGRLGVFCAEDFGEC